MLNGKNALRAKAMEEAGLEGDSIQRSGKKANGAGKWVGSLCRAYIGTPTVVPAGMRTPSISIPPSKTMRGRWLGTGAVRRRVSSMTA